MSHRLNKDDLVCGMTEEEFDKLWMFRSLMYCDAEVLYTLITKFKPQSILELGRYIGMSAKVMALAIRDNGSGSIISVDLASVRKQLVLDDDDLEIVEMITMEETEYLKNVPDNTFDMVFEDTNHAADLIAAVAPELVRVIKPGGIILFHNADWNTVKEGFEQCGIESSIYNFSELNSSSIALLEID